jgi:hypothetical protein
MRLLLAAMLLSLQLSAQNSNAIFFTENGERFQVVLNGVLQNSNPETNVKLTELPAPHYKCRILFADTKLGYVDFNLVFPEQGHEVTYNIKKNNKGEYVVRYVSDIPIAQAPPAPSTQPVIVYSTTPAVTTTTTTVQQSHTTSPGGENFNLNIQAGEEGGSISIHAGGMNDASGYSSTTTTTTRSVTTTTHDAPPSEVVYVTGYSGRVGCQAPMNQSEFDDVKRTISSKDFENTKLTISKQILQRNCLTSSQVRDLLGVFDFESTKLDFAKFAYDRTYDVGNYYKVNDAFEFESSVEDLNEYISSR